MQKNVFWHVNKKSILDFYQKMLRALHDTDSIGCIMGGLRWHAAFLLS